MDTELGSGNHPPSVFLAAKRQAAGLLPLHATTRARLGGHRYEARFLYRQFANGADLLPGILVAQRTEESARCAAQQRNNCPNMPAVGPKERHGSATKASVQSFDRSIKHRESIMTH